MAERLPEKPIELPHPFPRSSLLGFAAAADAEAWRREGWRAAYQPRPLPGDEARGAVLVWSLPSCNKS